MVPVQKVAFSKDIDYENMVSCRTQSSPFFWKKHNYAEEKRPHEEAEKAIRRQAIAAEKDTIILGFGKRSGAQTLFVWTLIIAYIPTMLHFSFLLFVLAHLSAMIYISCSICSLMQLGCWR